MDDFKTNEQVTTEQSITDEVSTVESASNVEENQPAPKPKKISTLAGRRRGELIFYFCIAALPLIHYFIFYIGVNIGAIGLAFSEFKMVNGEQVQFFSLYQFEKIWYDLTVDPVLVNLLKNSASFYLYTQLIVLPLALFFSYYIYKKMFASEFYRVMLYIPTILSGLVMGTIYYFIVDKGYVQLFKLFGQKVLPPLANPKNHMTVVIVFHLLMSFGTNVIMYSSAMTRIPVSVVEYAQIDGVGPLREFFTMTIPLIFPTLSTFLVVGVTGLLTDQAGLVSIFGNNAPDSMRTIGYQMFVKVAFVGNNTSQYPYYAALGICCTILVVPITMFVRWGLNKLDPSVQY